MELIEVEREIFFNTYKRLGVVIEKGEGVYLIDRCGKRYLDMLSGIGVNVLGYGNKKIREEIKKQIEKYIHLSNLFVQEKQVELAEKLLRYTGYNKIFFTNTGAEAIETAIKISRRWGKRYGKVQIIGFTNSFHGRTMGALSLMDRHKYRDGYEPFLPEFISAKYNDISDIESRVNQRTAAVFIEFIQGEGGIIVADPKFIERLFELREKFNFLVVADEIQSGLGRTGRFFAFEHYGVRPDIVTLAKPLGGGLPLGAVLGNEKVGDVLTTGSHGSTFGGNPVSCSAGCVVVDEIINRGIMKNAETIGRYLINRLNKLKERHAIIREVRGLGLMIGIELKIECIDYIRKLLDRGVIANCTSNNVIRLLPPLIISKDEVDLFISKLDDVLSSG
jgi:acetylornithine aminotransferase